MSRLVPLALVLVPVLASLFAVLACSGDDTTLVSQPTATRASDATARPTATPQPPATATPQVDRSESAQDKQPSHTQGLAPLNVDDPREFLAALSAQEQSLPRRQGHRRPGAVADDGTLSRRLAGDRRRHCQLPPGRYGAAAVPDNARRAGCAVQPGDLNVHSRRVRANGPARDNGARRPPGSLPPIPWR